MKEIRWHGRGGNGAFTAARLLGLAASVYGGNYAQAFPSFGPERRGAPVLGFTRIDDKVISDHSQVAACDCVIVLDETLADVVDLAKGLKPEGYLVINTAKSAAELKESKIFAGVQNLIPLDGTTIALETLGQPIVNTIMLGAAAAAADIVEMKCVEQAIDDLLPKNIREKNKQATMAAYNKVKGACQ